MHTSNYYLEYSMQLGRATRPQVFTQKPYTDLIGNLHYVFV